MTDHSELPNTVAALFNGLPRDRAIEQEPVGWSRKAWTRLSGHQDLLDRLESRLGRADVTQYAARITDASTALDAFVVAMVWGHGRSGYGPFRTARVIDENGGAEFVGAEFYAIARTCFERGGTAAFADIAERRKQDKGYLKHLGPAFGTKFLHFCTKAAFPDVPVTPIMDAVVGKWFDDNIGEGLLRIWWWDLDSYREYVRLMTSWSESLGVSIEAVELAILGSTDPDERSGVAAGVLARRPPDAAQALTDLSQALAGLLDPAAGQEARPLLDRLGQLIEAATPG